MTYYNIQVAKCIDAKLIDRNAFDHDHIKNLIVTLDRSLRYDEMNYINFNLPEWDFPFYTWNNIYGSYDNVPNSIITENDDNVIEPKDIINKYVIISSEPIYDSDVSTEEDLYIELSNLENPSLEEIDVYLKALEYCKDIY